MPIYLYHLSGNFSNSIHQQLEYKKGFYDILYVNKYMTMQSLKIQYTTNYYEGWRV